MVAMSQETIQVEDPGRPDAFTLDRSPTLSPLKRALLAIDELQSRLAAVEGARTEPIAVIGMGCRLPGGVENPQQYWSLLQAGRDAVGSIPPGRWDDGEFHDSSSAAGGKMYSRQGGYLANSVLEGFEASFFGLSPREAMVMDPQQRILLEVSWE